LLLMQNKLRFETNLKRGIPRRQRRLCRAGLMFLSLIGAIGVGVVGGSWLVAYVALHPPSRITDPTSAERIMLATREITFVTADGLTLNGWHAPGTNHATVILVHGFARERHELLREAQWLSGSGFGVLLFDTRAQGASEGANIGFGLSEGADVRAAVDFVRDRSPEEAVGVMGYSMGAVAAIQAAAQDTRIGAVLVVSPYADPRQLIDYRLGFARPLAPLLIWWGERMSGLHIADLQPLVAVTKIAPRPILIMEAGNDTMLPPNCGRQLYEAASDPKGFWSAPDVPHVGFAESTPHAYRERLLSFFEQSLILE
jgi:alpha-beta hydrolase superfamily lysophospholipase